MKLTFASVQQCYLNTDPVMFMCTLKKAILGSNAQCKMKYQYLFWNRIVQSLKAYGCCQNLRIVWVFLITIRGIYEMSKILKNHKTWTKYEKLKISENYDIKKMYLFWQVIFLRIKWLVLYNVNSKLKQFVLNVEIFALSQVIKQSTQNSISFFWGSTYWT